MPAVYHIVLRDTEGYEPEPVSSRRFTLLLGSTFPIGRASRNTTKAELMPAEHNAFIDSPVISRDHAVLSATGDEDAPQIFVTDSKSMHGTFVNGERLEAHTPKQLKSGDILQFGVDVNRNEEYFIARRYTFEATLMQPQAPFSLGYQVPDSDGEDIAGTNPRRGSQYQPLTIHDSDSESETSDNEQADATMFAEGFTAEEIEDSQAGSSLHEAYGQPSSDDEQSLGDYPSDDHDHDTDLEQDTDGEVSNRDGSEVDYTSDFDVPEVVDIEMEAAEAELEDELETASAPFYSQAAPAPADLTTPAQASMPPWAVRESSTSYSSMMSQDRSELPSMSIFKEAIDSSVFHGTFPPPFPPRPSSFRLYNRVQDAGPQNPPWSPNDTSTFSDYLGTNHGDRPSLFSPAPGSIMSPGKDAEPPTSVFSSPSVDFAPTNFNSNRLQTPPSIPNSDVIPSTPPPGRRTKVSITEIVEEQPPTPTSVNEMKRKADVLESEETPETEAQAIVAAGGDAPMADAAVDVPADVAAAQTAAIIAQRPKKQPRSLVKKLGNTAAFLSYGAVGAAGAFALLTCLPDAFFV